ncbi:MAG: hypothetical protein JWO00_662 [Candidatus Parcubacteria bacterium]|nr:hypothetical protein [Candidatus Parcubacteria bacterium]
MEQFEHAIGEIFDLIWEMVTAILSVIPTILKFITWALLSVVILPCVWVASTVYPWWVEWGEDF